MKILSVEVRLEHHVVLARQRARQIAAGLGFEAQEQARIATAVSEIARNALRYAGGGQVLFAVEGGPVPVFLITIRDDGPGIENLEEVLEGRYASDTGLGLGLIGSRRLMDRFRVDSEPGRGTTVVMGKLLPRGAPVPNARTVSRITEELARSAPENPLDEIQQQNQELLRTLEEVRLRQAEIERLNRTLEAANRELAETNRGMVALYAELDDRAEALRRASEVKSRFLSYMSHEFRTPLGSVLRLSQLLLDRLDGELTGEQERQVLMIRKASEGLADMVDDLLDLGKIEAGKLTVHASPFQVEALFGTLRGMFRPLVVPGHVDLVIEAVGDLPELYTDEAKVSQVLRNFISNALKFTLEGEVRVRAALGDEDTVVFAVSDTGIGIAPEHHERIFAEFAQVDSPAQRRVKGTGLGLPLSRRLAELLGGGVHVESEPGKGSTFSLVLPRVLPGAALESDQEAPAARAARAPEEQILIVDDDETSRYVLRRLLAALPYGVLEAKGGEEGLRLARTPGVRALLLDLMMPDLPGLEVLERLKADPATREIPVVVVTSLPVDTAMRERLAPHTAGVISKLASGSDMAARTREALYRAGVLPRDAEDP